MFTKDTAEEMKLCIGTATNIVEDTTDKSTITGIGAHLAGITVPEVEEGEDLVRRLRPTTLSSPDLRADLDMGAEAAPGEDGSLGLATCVW
jgi:hypothetical protein